MKKDESLELICDIEGRISNDTPNRHAYLEIETAYHDTQPDAFLSLFTRRDRGAGDTEGTEVWLDAESARTLAEEILEWCDEQEGDDGEIFDSIEDDDYEQQFEEKGFYYGKAKDVNFCPHCGAEDICAYSQDKWVTPVVWCDSCNSMIDPDA